MNKTFRLFLLYSFLAPAIVNLSHLHAAESRLVASAKPGMHWTVKISPSSTRPLQESAVTREEVSLTNKVRQEAFTFHNGTHFTRYIQGESVLYMDPRTGEPAIQSTDDDVFFGGPLLTGSFPEYDWVSKRWYQGTQKLNDRECDVYVHPWPITNKYSTDSIPHNPAKTDKNKFAIAYIDAKSRLPVLLETPDEIRAYTFIFDAPAPSIPSVLTEALAQREAAIRWRKQRFRIPQ